MPILTLLHQCIGAVTRAGTYLIWHPFISAGVYARGSVTPALLLAPANASVSAGVSVTLGCRANVEARLCQWSFFSQEQPLERRDLAAFSPSSRHSRERGKSDPKVKIYDKRIHKTHVGAGERSFILAGLLSANP